MRSRRPGRRTDFRIRSNEPDGFGDPSYASRHLLAPLFVSLCLAVWPGAFAWADDWPQFLGPQRNGVSAEKGLATFWPKNGPPLVWEKQVGEGYSGPVVSGQRLILFHRVGDEEVVECLNAGTGKGVWKFAYATDYQDALNKGNGPRSTPVMADEKVITLGPGGWLHCLEMKTGQKVWGRNIVQDYRVPGSYFGVGTSPLVEDNRVLVNVGGKGAGIVAFDLGTGKEVWKATTDGASYSSPVAGTVDGVRHALFFTRQGVVILDPKTGTPRFTMRWRARIDASVNAATPLLINDLAFFSTSYDTGALLLKLRKDGADIVWQNDESMSNHYNTCIHHNGFLYGFHGRQEVGADFRCVELKTGKVKWEQRRYGCASLVLADGHLIVLTEEGDLVLVDATPEAYREKARVSLLSHSPSRAQIALADGHLYARDLRKLGCWRLRRTP
jgi:outer membrane protein assembly factor BamB